ncbi:FkbM family methyltransferase [Candidatus Epulonipiscium viviparus]|uniref:FkbM family methyltransferase n=1 Tax=Candidatus Epulonipiscium viviparus TaxID=420336 RepID=UPI00016C088F|nr:FkbM family methyltransferase [Candidatus Epulopiscium viviparus]
MMDETGTTKITFNEIKTAYESLADDLSREIFDKRIQYAYKQTPASIEELGKLNVSSAADAVNPEEKITLRKEVEKFSNPTIIIYGAGVLGHSIFEAIKDIKKVIFCVSNPSDIDNVKTEDGIKVISKAELLSTYSDTPIIIASHTYFSEILDSLISIGIHPENIINILKFMFENNYFDKSIISFNENEVFVDVGVYNASTSIEFAEKYKQNYKKIYLFEADPKLAKLSKQNLEISSISNYEIYDVGLWDKKDTLKFENTQSSANCITTEGNIIIHVDTLDNYFIHDKTNIRDIPTFIKMDIEGAELEALKGGEQLIKQYAPKLAICVYHKLEDVIIITNWLKNINPKYTMYLRHHGSGTNSAYETVLYAIQK